MSSSYAFPFSVCSRFSVQAINLLSIFLPTQLFEPCQNFHIRRAECIRIDLIYRDPTDVMMLHFPGNTLPNGSVKQRQMNRQIRAATTSVAVRIIILPPKAACNNFFLPPYQWAQPICEHLGFPKARGLGQY